METLQVIKIGGNVIDNEAHLSDFLKLFATLDGNKILVHGGGKLATHLAERLHVAVEMVEGRRVTNDDMIDIVTMTYGGLINKRIVAKLQALSQNALGMTGADLNLIKSAIRKSENGVHWGWVGDPLTVEHSILLDLLNKKVVPVIAPLTHDKKGNILNTNADTIAYKIAESLSKSFEVELNFTFDLRGVMKDIDDPGSLIEEIRRPEYEVYKSQKIISGGMVPKLENAFEAIAHGVKKVRIMHYEDILKIEKKEIGGYTSIY